MCWITLRPKEGKHQHQHHGHDHHHYPHLHRPHRHMHKHHKHEDRSAVEHLVRRERVSVDRVSFEASTTDHSSHYHGSARVRIVTPILADERRCHHEDAHDCHCYHIDPLRAHPVKLHGHGRRRVPLPKPPPPSRCSPPPTPSVREPIYRIQPIFEPREPEYRIQPIIERRQPEVRQIRDTTRIALREAKPARGRLRRVAGYDVLGKRVPWSWDCVSSTVGSSVK